MKKINTLVLGLLGIFLGVQTAGAQESVKEEKVKAEMKVRVIKSEDGAIEEVDEHFSIEDEEGLNKLLNQYGVEMSIEELKKTYLSEMDGDSGAMKATGFMKVKLIKDENGEKEEINKTYSIEDEEKVKELLKEHGINMTKGDAEGAYKYEMESSGEQKKVIVRTMKMEEGELDKDIEQNIHVYKLQSNNAESHENSELFEAIEKAAEEGDYKKIMELVSDKEAVWHSDETPGVRKVVVSYEIKEDSDIHDAIMFFKKKSKVELANDAPTSIDQSFKDNSSIEQLKLFPNPANDHFNMNFISKEPKDYQLTITDSKGSKIFEKQLNNFEGNFNEDFDLSKYESGLYFFNLRTGEELISKKIVVL